MLSLVYSCFNLQGVLIFYTWLILGLHLGCTWTYTLVVLGPDFLYNQWFPRLWLLALHLDYTWFYFVYPRSTHFTLTKPVHLDCTWFLSQWLVNDIISSWLALNWSAQLIPTKNFNKISSWLFNCIWTQSSVTMNLRQWNEQLRPSFQASLQYESYPSHTYGTWQPVLPRKCIGFRKLFPSFFTFVYWRGCNLLCLFSRNLSFAEKFLANHQKGTVFPRPRIYLHVTYKRDQSLTQTTVNQTVTYIFCIHWIPCSFTAPVHNHGNFKLFWKFTKLKYIEIHQIRKLIKTSQ